MRTVYNLLHFSHKTPKHLYVTIPNTVPDVDMEKSILLSILSEDNSQSFALSPEEIGGFILSLSYAREMLQVRKIAGDIAKY